MLDVVSRNGVFVYGRSKCQWFQNKNRSHTFSRSRFKIDGGRGAVLDCCGDRTRVCEIRQGSGASYFS